MEAELKKKYYNVNRQVKDFFGTLRAASIEEKDTETGISCTSSTFILHELSVSGRLD
jgi:hypothetical protein